MESDYVIIFLPIFFSKLFPSVTSHAQIRAIARSSVINSSPGAKFRALFKIIIPFSA
jgi:hypothetical protein